MEEARNVATRTYHGYATKSALKADSLTPADADAILRATPIAIPQRADNLISEDLYRRGGGEKMFGLSKKDRPGRSGMSSSNSAPSLRSSRIPISPSELGLFLTTVAFR